MSELIVDAASSRHEHEDKEVMNFDDYRFICDRVNDFRKIGIQEPKSYAEVVFDRRTVFVEYEGKKVPLLAPIEYEKMYDQERCAQMTARSNIMLLGLPLNLVESDYAESEIMIDPDTAIIIEEFVDPSEPPRTDKHTIPTFLANNHPRAIDFKHPDLANLPMHEAAWMAGYSFVFGPSQESGRPFSGEHLDQDLISVWQDYCAENGYETVPSENANGTFFLSAEQLAEMPEIIEGLWAISGTGFGKILGAHHPVAMEFNRDFFDQQIVAENTATAVHYVEGRPVCFGFIGLDMNNNDWLNCKSSAMVNDIEQAKNAHRPYVHFHELISNGFEGMGYSTNILKTFLELARRTGYDYSLFFESTNLSSTYIPHIIEKEIGSIETLSIKHEIEMKGKLTYWALVADD